MPIELLNEKGSSFLHTRLGKLALGVLATILIVGGLMMFLTDGTEDERSRYADSDLADEEDAPKLLIVEQDQSETASQETDPQPAAESASQVADSESANQTATEQPADPVSATPETGSEANPTAAAETAATAVQAAENAASDVAAAASSESDSNPDSSDAQPAGADDNNAIEQDVADSTDISQNDVAAVPDASDDSNSGAESESGTESGTESEADAASDPDPGALAGLESPNWILVQSPSQFTVQMSASRDRPSVENFLQRNIDALPPPNSIYTFNRNGDTWYALVNGIYSSINDARSAVEKMPASAQTNQPWIRNIGRVQAVLKAQ